MESQMTLTGPWGTLDFSPPNVTSTSTNGLYFLPAELATVTIETDSETPAAEAEEVRWEAVLALEGVPTDDSTPAPRIILPEALSWRDLPISLMAMTKVDGEGHAGHEIAGRIDEIWRVPRTDLGENVWAVMGRGVFDTGEFGQEIGRLVADKTLRGVSIDPVAVQWSLVDAATLELVDEATLTAEDIIGGGFYIGYVSASIAAATVCPTQALEGATISILVASATESHIEGGNIWIAEDEETLVACAAGPLAPPASWFEKPNLRRLTQVTVTDAGQVFGHIRTRECHAAHENTCMKAPDSRDGYRRFHTAKLVSAEGEHVPVGRISVKPHAPHGMTPEEVMAYYSDVKYVASFVRLYDDEFGTVCAGVTRSDAPPELLRDFYANPPSGEWRRGELLGISCVWMPGLGVPEPEALLVASGGVLEVERLILPPVDEFVEEVTEADVLVAAAALQGPEALAALIAE